MCWLCLSLWGFDGPNRTLCAGFAAEPIGRRVPVGVLVFAIMILDDLVIAFTYAGIEGAANAGNPWSHGLCIQGSGLEQPLSWLQVSIVTTMQARLSDFLCSAIGCWSLFPIPSHFSSCSWRSWQWSYGHPLPPDLSVPFGDSQKVGLGPYNSISAVEATLLEPGMFILEARDVRNVRPKRKGEDHCLDD